MCLLYLCAINYIASSTMCRKRSFVAQVATIALRDPVNILFFEPSARGSAVNVICGYQYGDIALYLGSLFKDNYIIPLFQPDIGSYSSIPLLKVPNLYFLFA